MCPDGVMTFIKQKNSSVTLRFCEVKPEDSKNLDLLANNYIRLATLSTKLPSRKANRFALCFQALGIIDKVCHFIEF